MQLIGCGVDRAAIFFGKLREVYAAVVDGAAGGGHCQFGTDGKIGEQVRVYDIDDSLAEHEDGDGGCANGLRHANACKGGGGQAGGAIGRIRWQLSDGGEGFVGGLVFDHQLHEQFAGAVQFIKCGSKDRLVLQQVFFSDAVVERHLTKCNGECADKGSNAPTARRWLAGGGGGKEILDRGRSVVHQVLRFRLR